MSTEPLAVHAVCLECGKPFSPQSRTQLYCSRLCARTRRYRMFKAGGRYEDMKREKRERSARLRTYQLSACPYASGALKMPDGGRVPDTAWGY